MWPSTHSVGQPVFRLGQTVSGIFCHAVPPIYPSGVASASGEAIGRCWLAFDLPFSQTDNPCPAWDKSCHLLRPCLANFAINKSVMDDLTSFVALLEKVGDSGIAALAVDVTDPFNVQLPSLSDTGLFTSRDDPSEAAIQVRSEVNWTKQRLCRNPTQHSGDALESVKPVKRCGDSASYAEPNIGIAITPISRKTICN